jgi:hypothetical protein
MAMAEPCEVCRREDGTHGHEICRGLHQGREKYSAYLKLDVPTMTRLQRENPTLHQTHLSGMNAFLKELCALEKRPPRILFRFPAPALLWKNYGAT